MSNRYHEHDVKTKIKSILDSNFNNMIETIRIERSDNTIPLAQNITHDVILNQYPEIYIDITGSEIMNDQELTDNIDIITESFDVEVSCVILINSYSIESYGDYYNEALKRILHGYNDSYITWIGVISTIQRDLQDQNTNQTYKICGVTLQVLVP
jgi:hypothetical protein